MCDRIRHRGPDDAGAWSDGSAGFAVAHRRLSILDLSAAGAQPMSSSDERFVIAFNGEIYNYLEMKAEIERARGPRPWRGHSDTEVLVEAIAVWGLAGALKRTVGMYALALWDRKEKKLSLARDRAGEKPLYYGWIGDRLLFGSELKAFGAHGKWKPELDRAALAKYLRYGYVPSPRSIYARTFKVPPGTIAEAPAAALAGISGRPLRADEYWSLRASLAEGARAPARSEEAIDELERLVRQSVRGQMVADVPVGAFLSGGVDSSTVVALMQAQSGQRVRTFSIGFPDRGYDEARHARAVAAHLGTDHTELYVQPSDAHAVIARLAEIYDEPFADVSAVPTHIVSSLARKSVTVSLSGDGGDELFGGYNRYVWPARIRKWRALLPHLAWRALGSGLGAVPSRFWGFPEALLARALPMRWRYGSIADKVAKLAGVLALASPEEVYFRLAAVNPRPSQLLQGCADDDPELRGVLGAARLRTAEEQMMYADFMTYLPDDILVKLDRASMAVGLESRVPLLDHRIIEFAWRLPLDFMLREGAGKWILRQVLYRHVPAALTKRPKMGFGMPLDSWLRGPLRGWAEDLLSETALGAHGLLDTRQVRHLWHEHLQGTHNRQYQLWTVLMFQAWLRRRPAPAA